MEPKGGWCAPIRNATLCPILIVGLCIHSYLTLLYLLCMFYRTVHVVSQRRVLEYSL